jgi:hypothetical protein
VKSVSRKADPKTWTGVVHVEDGRLPDLKAWQRDFNATAGELFTLHGVEATIDGVLLNVKGEPALKVSGSDVVLRLQPLKQKVQWNPGKRCPQAPTREEKQAYQRLAAGWAKHAGPPPRVRIIGPLVQGSEKDASPTLTVREYVWGQKEVKP